MERLPQHAQRPFGLCHRGRRFTGWPAGRVGIRRQDRTAVGDSDGVVLQHARRPFGLRWHCRLFAGQAAGRVDIKRQDDTAVGDRWGCAAARWKADRTRLGRSPSRRTASP